MNWPAKYLLPSFLLLLASGCPVVDPSPVCEVDPTIAPLEPLDPCESGGIVASLTVGRKPGPPNSDVTSFRLSTDSELCFLVTNLPNPGGQLIASGTVSLSMDGVDVAAPSDLNQNVASLVRRTSAAAGVHELRISVASVPGAALEVVVFAARSLTPADTAAAEELARLASLTCDETNLLQGLVDEDERERIFSTWRENGMPPGILRVIYNSYGIPAFLSPLPMLDLGLPSGSSAGDIADAWLVREAALFRLDPARHVLVREFVKDLEDGSARVHYAQFTDGLPVSGAGISLYTDAFGTVRKIIGNLVPDVSPALSIVLSEEDATAIALAAVAAAPEAEISSAELLLMDLSREIRSPTVVPAWNLRIDDAGRRSGVWVNAETGDVLAIRRLSPGVADVWIFDGVSPDPLPPPPTMLPDPMIPGLLFFDDGAGTTLESPDCNGVPPGTGFSGCERVRDAVLAQRANWATFLDRPGGWSGAGSADGTLSADEPFVIELGTAPAGTLAIFEDGIVKLENDLARHGDIVSHEECHGFDQAERNFPDGNAVNLINATFGEHIADVCAMILDDKFGAAFGFGGNPLRIERNSAVIPNQRRHELTVCTGYNLAAGDTCDFVNTAGGAEDIFFGCREYLHLGNFNEPVPDFPPMDPFFDPFNVPNPARNSCIFTKPAALLLQTLGPVTAYRGVIVPAMDAGLVELVWDKLYRFHMADLTSGSLDTVMTFSQNLLEAAGAIDNFCRTRTHPLCPATLSFTVDARVGKALDAAGFWSPPLDVPGLGSSPRSIGVAEVRVTPMTMEVWIFFVRPGVVDHLQLYRIDDLFKGFTGTITDLSTIPAFAMDPDLVRTSSHVSADIRGNDVRVAFVSDATGNINVLEIAGGDLATATVLELPVPAPTGFFGGASIAMTPTATFLAYKGPAGMAEVRWLTLEDPTLTPQILETDLSASAPALAYDASSDLLHVVYRKDVTMGAPFFFYFDLPHHRSITAATVVPGAPASWSAATEIYALGRHLEAPPRAYASWALNMAPGLAIHQNHLQLLVATTLLGDAKTALDNAPTHLTVPLTASGAPDFSRPSRLLLFDEPSLTINGLVRIGDGVFAFWKPLFAPVRFARKRSE